MKSDIQKIFNHSNCLTHSEMSDYISGQISPELKRKVEIHIADCMMCADELEGLSNMKNPNDLEFIVDEINEEIDIQVSNKAVINPDRKRTPVKRIFAIAASIALLVTAGFFVNQFFKGANENLAEMAQEDYSLESEENAFNEESKTSEIIVEESDAIDTGDKIVTEEGSHTIESPNERDKFDNEDTDEELSIVVDFDDVEKTEQEFEEVAEEENINRKELVDEMTEDVISTDELAKTKTESTDEPFFGHTSRHIDLNKKANKDKQKRLKSIRSSSMLSYDEKVYNEASEGFDEYLEYNDSDKEVIFKNGVSQYYLKQYTEALNSFNSVLSFGQNPYFDDAEWYKIQTLLKLGKKEDATILLKSIISKKGKYKNKAEDVLKQL